MKLLKSYRVSTHLKDMDYMDRDKAKAAFEAIKETASLWRAARTIRNKDVASWIAIKYKVVRHGRTTYHDY